jgi:hypothetical protein
MLAFSWQAYQLFASQREFRFIYLVNKFFSLCFLLFQPKPQYFYQALNTSFTLILFIKLIHYLFSRHQGYDSDIEENEMKKITLMRIISHRYQ